MIRCHWVNPNNKIYIDYHDNEWGVPLYDDNKIYEIFLLECFQSGLSWECILNKREFFRQAYDGFDYVKISKYNDIKINELLNNKNIIRNKLKINASIKNTKIFIDIQKEFGSFSNYIWSFTNNTILYNVNKITNDISDKISKDLYGRGMRFVGSITIYSLLQAIGVINDHEINCFKHV